jgi:hypothetical protein
MDHKLISSFVQDADVTDRALHPQVTVQSYDGDTLICTVKATEPLFFTFVDNWDPDWERACERVAGAYPLGTRHLQER